MRQFNIRLRAVAVATLFVTAQAVFSAESADRKSVDELRNTVINVLQALVDRGVLTREQAEKIVEDAQSKAASNAAALAAQEKAEESAVRVPYVPEIVKEEIRNEVKAELAADVTREVVDTAQAEGWGVPAALPQWIRNVRWYGDVRVRGEQDLFASDNIPNLYLDFQRVNEAGGIAKAGYRAFSNVTEDRDRMRYRLRFGFEADLGAGWSMGARLATGSLGDPVSANQTLGGYGQRGQIGADLAWLRWQGTSASGHQLGVTAGRMDNPFLTASELVYDQDLAFDGLAMSFRYALGGTERRQRGVFATAGVFPVQEVDFSGHDKWLVAEQLGVDLPSVRGSRTRFGVSWNRFINIAGKRNAFGNNLLDYTAPQVMRRGNTVFDIRNDNDTSTNLYALAADFDLLNVSLVQDFAVGSGRQVTVAGDYVRNFGYSESRMAARTGFAVPEKSTGYLVEIAYRSGVPGASARGSGTARAWSAAIGYRYLEREAVLDAFTDSDFHLGGTDAKGFTVSFDYNFTSSVRAHLKYFSASEIDGPPLGIDVVHFDVTASF